MIYDMVLKHLEGGWNYGQTAGTWRGNIRPNREARRLASQSVEY
jgi:hypothetical protein